MRCRTCHPFRLACRSAGSPPSQAINRHHDAVFYIGRVIGFLSWRFGGGRASALVGATLLLGALGMGAVGCGSSGGGASSTANGHTGTLSVARALRSGGEKSPVHPPASKRSRADTSRTGPRTHETPSIIVRSHSFRCPRSIPREQCKAFADQAAKHLPSYPLKIPRDCLKAMSRADCEAMLKTQRAAHKRAGPSVNVERCLKEETRARCEAQLGPQLRAQRAELRRAGE